MRGRQSHSTPSSARASSANVDAERFGSLSNERAGRTAATKPRVAGSGRLKCSMRAVQSYPCRQPALRMLSDRSPANAAFVAWCAFEIILSKREINETTGPGHPGFRVLGTRQQILSFLFMNGFSPKPKRGHVTIAVALIGAAVTLGFAIWQSQKGKHQVPAIIDNQHVLGGQR